MLSSLINVSKMAESATFHRGTGSSNSGSTVTLHIPTAPPHDIVTVALPTDLVTIRPLLSTSTTLLSELSQRGWIRFLSSKSPPLYCMANESCMVSLGTVLTVPGYTIIESTLKDLLQATITTATINSYFAIRVIHYYIKLFIE